LGKYFGTDGIRGIVNETLDSRTAFLAGAATATALGRKLLHKTRPVVTIGRDTRISGDMLESALLAGLCSSGADVIRLGVVPTPAVAFITRECGADAGIVISASHNPFEHNGIKIFGGAGFKFPDETENEIEALMDAPERLETKKGSEIGRVLEHSEQLVAKYSEHVAASAQCSLAGLKVIIDCANGAASRTADDVFGRLDLEPEIIKDHPDGVNINESCGSTHIERLGKMVVAGGFDVGLAFDGDADRCLAVDETGCPVDGDKIMAICAMDMLRRGKLKGNALVATVMSNLGLHEYCHNRGIELHCAAVGDRNVLEMMQEKGFNLGGEQSGHMIFLDDETTGDGQLAAVRFLSVLAQSGKKLSELVSEIPTYPQVLLNVSITGGNGAKEAIMADSALTELIAECEAQLGDTGRILVRPSGTEALIRVMVEAKESIEAQDIAERIALQIKDNR
jgi:phosphoglucosamine mutase